MVKSDKATNLVWMDLEMTGLDVDRNSIIEIATIITNKDLEVIAEGPVIAIATSKEQLATMDDFVLKMHTNNGLLARVKDSTISLAEAEQLTLDFIKEHTLANSNPLCGNSIGTDKMFLLKYMPRITAWLHYRTLDVSSIKILNQNWYSDNPSFAKNEDHLALGDIRNSIKELAYYRDTIFKHSI